MERLCRLIEAYVPVNEQEQRDKNEILRYCRAHPSCFDRTDATAHLTASIWTLNRNMTKTLFVYHKLYDSWSWVGGHADGDRDLAAVAMRELCEETGVKNARLVSNDIFSLEILTVDGHVKNGEYVPSHLHLNITFAAVADDSETLIANEAENTGVRWFSFDDALAASTEPWMVQRVYNKLIAKSRVLSTDKKEE